MTKTGKLRAWVSLSRPPFHTVGILPYILGALLAWQMKGTFRWDIWICGTIGVVLVMLATYYSGEYWDYVEDSLSAGESSTPFAGGSQVVQRGLLPRRAPLYASLVSLALAAGIGVILQFVFQTGVWTIPLGLVGVVGGFFYSTRPVRWVSRGVGELWIAFCYGWLPVAAGFYLQVGEIAPVINWLAVPIGFTIFNVVLLNEFLDFAADSAAGKRNLVVRLGQNRASLLYGFAGVGSWVGMFFSIIQGVPISRLWFYLPFLALSAVLVALVMGGRWKDRATLSRLCAANLLVNLGTTATYILAFLS